MTARSVTKIMHSNSLYSIHMYNVCMHTVLYVQTVILVATDIGCHMHTVMYEYVHILICHDKSKLHPLYKWCNFFDRNKTIDLNHMK